MIAYPRAGQATEFQLVELLVGLLEFRDPYFRSGSSLARMTAHALGQAFSLDSSDLHTLNLAALLRDVSRGVNPMGTVPLQGTLDDQEYIEKHVESTVSLLSSNGIAPEVIETVRHHHERWDGTGYPDGLKGDEIPLLARILAVADAFSAMVSPRPYRLPHRLDQALTELLSSCGRQHDPTVVQTLARIVAAGEAGPLGVVHHRRVLVAHPDRHRAGILAAGIGAYGYIAEVAQSLSEASAALDHSPTSTLLLSAGLAGTGVDAIVRGLRESERFGSLLILVTGVRDPAARARLLDVGADACFPGEIGTDEFRATLNSQLRRRHRASASAPAPEPNPIWHVLQGDLKSFTLAWVLQALKYDGRTASLRIQSVDGNTGAVFLDRGDPIHASTRESEGDEALRQMLKWGSGRFTVEPRTESGAGRNITSSLIDFLLTDAVAQDHAILGTVRVGD